MQKKSREVVGNLNGEKKKKVKECHENLKECFNTEEECPDDVVKNSIERLFKHFKTDFGENKEDEMEEDIIDELDETFDILIDDSSAKEDIKSGLE